MVQRGWVVLVLVAVLAAPAAAADLRIVSVAAPLDPLPFAENRLVTVVVEADCQSLLPRISPVGSESPVPAAVTWTPTGGLAVFGVPTIDLPVQGCLGGASNATASNTFQVVAARSTLALIPFPVALNVTLPPLSPLVVSLPGEHTSDVSGFSASVAPALASTLSVADKNQACACPEVVYHLTLHNRGNARALYSFHLADDPLEPGWSVDLPADVSVAPPALGGADADVVVRVHTPSGPWTIATFRIDVLVTAADGPGSPGLPLHAELLVTNPDFRRYEAAPAVGPTIVGSAVLVLPLVALAVWARRRP